MNAENKLLSPREAALILGICTKTLREWANDGDIKFFTTRGGHKRFAREELMNFLHRQKQPSE